jgi:lipopolysaccharide exporter
MSLADQVLASSTLLVAIKIFQRIIGLASILFLARLLTPSDFSIVALASITIHFFDILSNAGSEQYIIRKRNVDEDDLNTAWSIDILMKSGLWVILIISVPTIAVFFNQPELEDALYVLSLVLLINALKNPGLFLKKQNFEYKEIFWLSVLQRITVFFVVICIAYFERSYWALIVGDLISSLIFTIGTYRIDRFRPSVNLKKWKQQWHFSSWLLIKGIVGYTRSQIDTLIISKFYPPAILGQYYIARDVAMIPSHNIIAPAIEPLLAALKLSRDNDEEFIERLRLSLLTVSIISLPIGIFMAFFSENLVLTLLGDQWDAAVPILASMSLLLIYFSFALVFENALIALNRVKQLFWYDLLSLSLVTGGLLLFIGSTAAEFALLRGILGTMAMLGLYFYFCRIFGTYFHSTITLIFSNLSICLASAVVAAQVPTLFDHVLLNLIQQTFVYFFTLMSLALVIYWRIDNIDVDRLKNIVLGHLKKTK